jgi:signal transduction histidine kinase
VAGAAIGAASVFLTAWTSDPFSVNDTLWVALIVIAPWVTGRFVRRARERARLLEHRNVRLETERESAAARAAADERTRIARELHDVIAHALSLIVVQARGGRRMVKRERPADALDAFDTVEQAAQQALDEMRRLLGMLRENDGELALTPPPSLARLPDLITQVADAGLCADLVVEGEPRPLPPGIEVSAYRIVQEGLTNALRHSGTSRARVVVTYAADRLELHVLDEGAGGEGTLSRAGSGHGLIGIRERMAIYGGELHAGMRPEGGYALRARFPLVEAE